MRLNLSHALIRRIVVSIFIIFICFSSSLLCFFLISDSNSSNYLIFMTPISCKIATNRGFWRASVIISKTELASKPGPRRPSSIGSVVKHSLWPLSALSLCSLHRLLWFLDHSCLFSVSQAFELVDLVPYCSWDHSMCLICFHIFGPIHVSGTVRG